MSLLIRNSHYGVAPIQERHGRTGEGDCVLKVVVCPAVQAHSADSVCCISRLSEPLCGERNLQIRILVVAVFGVSTAGK